MAETVPIEIRIADLPALKALASEVVRLHQPEDQEAEFWSDGPGEDEHDRRFPECEAVQQGNDRLCEGHTATVQVCRECGYEHDGDSAIFRSWPCPTLRAFAEAFGFEPTAPSGRTIAGEGS